MRDVSLRCFLLLGLLFSCAWPRAAMAQASQAGVVAGFNISILDYGWDGHALQWDERYGAIAGPFIDAVSSRRFALRLEGLVSVKGGQRTLGPRTDDIQLTYVEVPVMLLFRDADRTRVFAAIGPTFGWLLRARHQLTRDGQTTADDIRDQFATFEPGLAVEVGIERRWMVCLRVSRGLGNIATDPQVLDMRNEMLSLLVGRRF
jgi:hypothetical protein